MNPFFRCNRNACCRPVRKRRSPGRNRFRGCHPFLLCLLTACVTFFLCCAPVWLLVLAVCMGIGIVCFGFF